MSKTVLESRPALKHLMSTVQQSSRALKRLMAEARASGDPASVLRTALAVRAAKDALRHATIGNDVERLTEALMDKAQELARLERLQDLASARRRLAIARVSIWSPATTTAAIDSAGHALRAALDDMKARHNIRHVFPAMA